MSERTPNYYVRNGMECCDWTDICLDGTEDKLTASQAGYVQQALQYIWRCPYKESLIDDLRKAQDLLEFVIIREETKLK